MTERTITVETGSEAYDRMEARRKKSRDLRGGTTAMRAVGETWLPREPGELIRDGIDPYRVRLGRTVLVPYFHDTIERLVGKLFSQDLRLGDDVQAPIRSTRDGKVSRKDGWEEDFDLRGRDFSQFGKQVLREMWAEGLPFVLVDHTAKVAPVNASREDDKRNGRPFAIYYPSKSVKRIVHHFEAGRLVYDRVHLEETATEPDGWGEKSATRMRVVYRAGHHGPRLEPPTGWESFASFEFYRKNDKGEWLLSSQPDEQPGLMKPHVDLPGVPFPFGQPGLEPLEVYPELDPLADLCIQHWQKKSDQDRCIHISKIALLHWAGMTQAAAKDYGPRFVGPFTLVLDPNLEGKLNVVETSGRGAEVGFKDLERLEAEIRWAGLAPMLPGRAQTLGEKVIDTAESESRLMASGRTLKDGLEMVLRFMAAAAGLGEAGGTAHVPADLTLKSLSAEQLQALKAARDGRAGEGPDLSLQTYHESLAAGLRGVLPGDFSHEEEAKRLAEEARLTSVDREERNASQGAL